MGFCNPAQFPKFFCPQLVSSKSLKNVLMCLPASLLAASLVKITLFLRNVSSPVGSLPETCWRKVPFSDELLPEDPCLGKLVGAIRLSRPGLLENWRAAISLYSSIEQLF